MTRSEGDAVSVGQAKGRPMLSWVGKRPLREVRSFPAQQEVLAHLLANGFRGTVDLVYIDPPFDWGADWVRKVQLRGASGSARLDGETYTLGEQIQYTDVDLIDVSERRADVVAGRYEVKIPAGSVLPVAVRITNMLGEEILVVEPDPGV